MAIAPGRGDRPNAPRAAFDPVAPDELEKCPFCGGREDRTPPETLRVGDPWRVRVVPNLYPAFERQEVVVHTPRHARSLAELGAGELADVAEAWRRRREQAPDGYLHALVNEGRQAGSSLPHTHSQLVWLPGQTAGHTASASTAIAGSSSPNVKEWSSRAPTRVGFPTRS